MTDVAKNLFKIILGIILLAAPLAVGKFYLPEWGMAALNLIKGGILLSVLFIGLILIILGFSEFRT